jgi:transcriptional regulator with XRE-family HTH domain
MQKKFDSKEFGKRIQKCRRDPFVNLSQDDLAQYLNLARNTVALMERGLSKIPASLELLDKLSKKFNRSVLWLMYGEESECPSLLDLQKHTKEIKRLYTEISSKIEDNPHIARIMKAAQKIKSNTPERLEILTELIEIVATQEGEINEKLFDKAIKGLSWNLQTKLLQKIAALMANKKE